MYFEMIYVISFIFVICFHFQFIVSPGSVVDFIGNKARVSGGGIMVDSPVVDHARNFLNRFCFVRFRDPDIPPQKWKVGDPEVGSSKDYCFDGNYPHTLHVYLYFSYGPYYICMYVCICMYI